MEWIDLDTDNRHFIDLDIDNNVETIDISFALEKHGDN